MNTLRKMRKNAKALSPVVASIILIAVTVAVSIAVAAWMGALVVGQMETEQLKITNYDFDGTADTITLTVRNPGTAAVTIDSVYVDNLARTFSLGTATDTTVPANGEDTVVISLAANEVVSGSAYAMKIVTSKGNYYTYTATAP